MSDENEMAKFLKGNKEAAGPSKETLCSFVTKTDPLKTEILLTLKIIISHSCFC